MDNKLFENLIANQVKWRGEYMERKRMKKEITKILGRQYRSKCGISKSIIKDQLLNQFNIPLMCIKENLEGYLFLSYLDQVL